MLKNMYAGSAKGKLYDVVLIRSLAIVLVVAFHAYGMMYAPAHFPNITEEYYNLYYNINQLILKFRMPLFIFISGYLFSYLEKEKGKYSTFFFLVKNKFCRLIIPYFVFAVVYMFTTGSFSFALLISGGCAHLWFITMLFWCFILTRLLRFLPSSDSVSFKIIVSIVCFGLLFYKGDVLPQVLGIHNVTKWYFWFYIGYVLSSYRMQLYDLLSNKILLVVLLGIWLFGVYYTIKYIKTDDIRSIYGELGHLSIVLLIWWLVNWIIINFPGRWLESPFFKELNRTSYGIFVLHNWLQLFMISKTAQRLFHLDVCAQSHMLLFPLSFFLLSLLLSYIGSVLLLRTKVGRFLIG